MKLKDIIRTASSNLRRSKARTILTILAIFIGSITLTLTNGIGSGIATYIDDQVGNIGAKDMLIIQGKMDNPLDGGPKEYKEGVSKSNTTGYPMVVLNTADLSKIKAQEGILEASFDFNTAPEYIYGASGKRYSFTPSSYYDGINLSMSNGVPPNNKAEQKQILLTPGYSDSLGFESDEGAIGKIVSIGIKNPNGEVKEVKATVVGVQQKTLMSAGGLQMNNALRDEMFGIQTEGLPAELKNQQPIVIARFNPDLSEEKVKEIKKALDGQGYSAITIEDQIGIFKQVINAVIMVLNFFAAIALLAASFGIVNTLLMSVQERTREIGLMKAMGMSRRTIFMLFSVEAILLGFWGSLLGSLAGIGVGTIANRVATDTFLKDLVGFELTSFPVTSVSVIMLVIMTIAFIAGTLPARRASKLNPIEALRYE